MGSTIRLLEDAAEVLKTLEAKGISKEQRSRLTFPGIAEPVRPPKAVSEFENGIISKMAKKASISHYDASLVFESVLNTLIKALSDGEKVKLNRLGTFYQEMRHRGQSVAFIPSPTLAANIAK